MSDENEQLPVPTVPAKAEDAIDLLIQKLDEHVFDLNSEEYPIKIKHKDGTIHPYVIRELGSEARETYLDFQAGKAKYSGKGEVTGIKDIKGLEIKLVAACLFDDMGGSVNENVIRATFPGKTTKMLSAIAARISGLDQQAEARAKNS